MNIAQSTNNHVYCMQHVDQKEVIAPEAGRELAYTQSANSSVLMLMMSFIQRYLATPTKADDVIETEGGKQRPTTKDIK